jgi:DNA-binding response OmpR family regulator
LEVSRQIRTFDKTIPIIFLSGETRQSEVDKAMGTGASAYLIKPNDFEKLPATIAELIEKSK